MSFPDLTARLEALLGADVAVSFDDGASPSQIRLYRPDPITDGLVRDAIGRARAEFPAEMEAITAVLMSFEGDLGPTRRRVIVD